VLARGLAKRCPRCAEKGMFLTWATLRRECTRCGLRFEAQEGGFLGAMTLNYMFAVAVWLAFMVGALVVTVPEVPVAPILSGSLAIMVVMPILLAARSKSLWAAVEFLILRSSPDYVAPAHPPGDEGLAHPGES